MRHVQNVLWLAVLCSLSLLADANIADWPGVYTMNHDGHAGTLTIVDTGRPCRVSPWCHLQISYKDSAGQIVPARITLIDQNWQHMVFFVMFPGNVQRFDAYLFSWDKTKMAGTTVWQGQTFGMFATKGAPETPVITGFRHRADAAVGTGLAHSAAAGSGGRCTPSGRPTSVVKPDGTVEFHYPDGSIRVGIGCSSSIICPDGTRIPASCIAMSAQPPTPPPAPNDDATKKWLQYHNDSLMDILTRLLGHDQNSIQNYKNSYEKGDLTVYQQMSERTKVITGLASQQ